MVVVAPGPRDEDRTVGTGGRIVRYRAPRMPYDPSYHAPLAFGRMRSGPFFALLRKTSAAPVKGRA